MVIGTAAFFFVFDACKSQDARVKAGGDGEGFRCHPGRAVREGIGADIFFDGFFGDYGVGIFRSLSNKSPNDKMYKGLEKL